MRELYRWTGAELEVEARPGYLHVVAWGGFAAGRKTYNDRQAADQAVARQASFADAGAGGEGDRIVASVDAFDQMLLPGGDAQ